MSIRNQLPGTVTGIKLGEVMAIVNARLRGGQQVTAVITRDAVEDLGIQEGSGIRLLVKSTEVALATEPVSGVSIRNQLPGQVAEVATGRAMAAVKVTIDGSELTAAITEDAATDLGLTPGSSVVALIKSTEVALAAE